jgi:hypothetical protein
MSDSAIADALRGVTTATFTTLRLKHGLRNTWLRGLYPPNAEHRARYWACKKARS